MENEPVFNPYAAPQADLTQPVPLNVEATRRHLLKHEASVKSIGILYTLGGIGLVLSGVSLFAVAVPEPLIAVVLLALGILQLWLAVGLRKLKKIVRIPTMILAGIGLIGFPIGTLISAYILYLLGSQKGVQVFSDEYAEVIAATPHIKYRSSKLVIVLVVLLVALVVFGVVAAVMSR
jgi:hypothetical protein